MFKRTSSPQRHLILAFAAFLVAVILWQMQGLYFLTFPLRLFVTMIHELGHGTAALLTGGSFLRFEVTERGAGMAFTSGGSRFAIIQAGYLGTAVFGAALLVIANHARRPGRVAAVLGLLIGGLTVLYSGISLKGLSLIETLILACLIIAALTLILTGETDQKRSIGLGAAAVTGLLLALFAGWGDALLTITVGLVSALALIMIGYRASGEATLVVLNFLAFLSGLQAITDSWGLFKIVTFPNSMMPLNDATAMAQAYGGGAALWALIWIGLDALIFGGAIYHVFVTPARRELLGRTETPPSGLKG